MPCAHGGQCAGFYLVFMLWGQQLQQLLNAHDSIDQRPQEWVVDRRKDVDWLAARVGIADFHHDAVAKIAVFVEYEDALCAIHTLQLLCDGVLRLVGGHGLGSTMLAWQRPLTEDTPRLEGVAELHHLLVESEAATDADGLHEDDFISHHTSASTPGTTLTMTTQTLYA